MRAVTAAGIAVQASTAARRHCHHSLLTHKTGAPLTLRTLRICITVLSHIRYGETVQSVTLLFRFSFGFNLGRLDCRRKASRSAAEIPEICGAYSLWGDLPRCGVMGEN